MEHMVEGTVVPQLLYELYRAKITVDPDRSRWNVFRVTAGEVIGRYHIEA
jgi:hypothetical protein